MWADKVYHPLDFFASLYEDIRERWGRIIELALQFLPSLDDKIWGLRRKRLVLVGGRPSQGKSTLMLQMAYSLAKQGNCVYFLSLDMSKEVCLERLISLECRIDNFFIVSGKISQLESVYKRSLSTFINDMPKRFTLVESWGKTFAEINLLVEKFPKPDIIFIDYVNLIRTGHYKKDVIDEYIKDLRRMAKDNNFCVVLGCQINRGTFDGHKVRFPEMWELKDSGALEEHSDLILLVHWPWFYDREKDKNEFWIRVAKNRDGKTGMVKCGFQPEFYRIYDRDYRGGDYGSGKEIIQRADING